MILWFPKSTLDLTFTYFFHRKSQWIPQENPQMSGASPQVASFLMHCQDASGGFAGGPQQLPHLAPTYAAVSALMVAGTEEAYKVPPDLKMAILN